MFTTTKLLVERLDALCDELNETHPEAAYAERWAVVCERLPALSDPARARAVQTLRFNSAQAGLIGEYLAQREYGTLYKLGMRGIWISGRRYLWPDFEAIPVEQARDAIRSAPAPLEGAMIEPESRLVRAILRVLIADPAGLAYYELAVRWADVLAAWSRPENTELVSVDEEWLARAPADGPYSVVQPHGVLGIGATPLEAAHDAYDSDGFIFELGARLLRYTGGAMVVDEEVLYLAPCSSALAHHVLAQGGAGIDWRWRDGRLHLANERLH